MNRLRDIRKNVLKISSTEKLAEILGGEETGYYHQKLQRIESGAQNMSEQQAFEISEKLQDAGYHVEAWHFFVDPKTINQSNQDEEKLLEKYRQLEEQEQQAFDAMIDSIIRAKAKE